MRTFPADTRYLGTSVAAADTKTNFRLRCLKTHAPLSQLFWAWIRRSWMGIAFLIRAQKNSSTFSKLLSEFHKSTLQITNNLAIDMVSTQQSVMAFKI